MVEQVDTVCPLWYLSLRAISVGSVRAHRTIENLEKALFEVSESNFEVELGCEGGGRKQLSRLPAENSTSEAVG